jgi:hypothetical protein
LNSKDDLKLIYKDKSFMILQKIKSHVKKFHVQFLNQPGTKTAKESCKECVNELKKFIFSEVFKSDDKGEVKLDEKFKEQLKVKI